jgi:hypothetical protein
MSPESVHKILEPLLLAAALACAAFALAGLLLWRDGRRVKTREAAER